MFPSIPAEDPTQVLQYALNELMKFEALKAHLREVNLYINFETLYTVEEENNA